jgi:hypothetical protein
MKKLLFLLFFLLLSCCLFAQEETLSTLAEQFSKPADKYRPRVWYHWLGSNISKEGITKDLEAMKEAGIGGGTIFFVTSCTQSSSSTIKNGPYDKIITFRSQAWWDALKHCFSESKRLGLQFGMHITPGYSTTGGPWVDEARGMQKLVWTTTPVEIAAEKNDIKIKLPKPELPVYNGYGSDFRRATYYQDVAVLAVPTKENVQPADIVELSKSMDKDGNLSATLPAGQWTIMRLGHAPTMSVPHPVPDDIMGKVLEIDKMSKEANEFFWKEALDPVKEHLGEFIGKQLTHIWVDSYEAGYQDWTAKFREEFKRIKGYDPLPFYAVKRTVKESAKRDDIKKFNSDYRAVVNSLFLDGFRLGKEKINAAGLQMFWEPYWSEHFDQNEGATIPDVAVNEFWSSAGEIGPNHTLGKITKEQGKKLIPAEALTGRPECSQYTEDPAWLKTATDAAFAAGFNMFYIHSWTHQPFDEKRIQPGFGFGWWGIHLHRNQTWIKTGAAYFRYLARCNMMLQYGEYSSSQLRHSSSRQGKDGTVFFLHNPSDVARSKTYTFPVTAEATPELWNPYFGTIQDAVNWKVNGDKTEIDIPLESEESVFVVFPKSKECAYTSSKKKNIEIMSESIVDFAKRDIPKNEPKRWHIKFAPQIGEPFERFAPNITDLTHWDDPEVKYFAGTATYERKFDLPAHLLGGNNRLVLNLGGVANVANVSLNGKFAATLWKAPYRVDITDFAVKGDNVLTVAVTTTWANRLIGDEKEPADFEWGVDREDKGRQIAAFPDWFVDYLKGGERPSKGRKTFAPWVYYRKESPLQPAGLLGPIRINWQKTK